MLDDGQGADAVAGDGSYTSVISSASYGPGDMVRWYVTADDSAGNTSRNPLFLDPANSPQYYGTVVQDPSVIASLPVVYWFVENVGGLGGPVGTRGIVYFAGRSTTTWRSTSGAAAPPVPRRSISKFSSTPATSSSIGTMAPRSTSSISTARTVTKRICVSRWPSRLMTGAAARAASPSRLRPAQRPVLRRADLHRGAGGGAARARGPRSARRPVQNVQHVQRGRVRREEDTASGRAARTSMSSVRVSPTPPARRDITIFSTG